MCSITLIPFRYFDEMWQAYIVLKHYSIFALLLQITVTLGSSQLIYTLGWQFVTGYHLLLGWEICHLL